MAFDQTGPVTMVEWPSRRPKPAGRRLARDLRTLAPFVMVLVQALAAGLTIVAVEWLTLPDPVDRADYGFTTSISWTSNVNAAPPGMPAGDPRSP